MGAGLLPVANAARRVCQVVGIADRPVLYHDFQWFSQRLLFNICSGKAHLAPRDVNKFSNSTDIDEIMFPSRRSIIPV